MTDFAKQKNTSTPGDPGLHLIFLTGLSGAGKSTAMHALEDLQFWCVDNLPMALVNKFVSVAQAAGGKLRQLAVVCDARAPDLVQSLPSTLSHLRQQGHRVELLFLDADDVSLQARYAQSHRVHPLLDDGDSVDTAIKKERKILQSLKVQASTVIDSSQLSVHELRREVLRLTGGGFENIGAIVLSFSRASGLPAQLDMLFDAEPLPTSEVQLWAQQKTLGSTAQTIVEHWKNLLISLYPQFVHEAKTYLTIGVVCHDGCQRSVPMAEALAMALQVSGIQAAARHRDLKDCDRKKTSQPRT